VPTRAEKPALTTDTEAGAAAVTVTPAVCVMPTALAVAETVFPCATVELKFVVKTPLALVEPDAGLNVLLVPVEAGVILALLIVLPNASRAVMVMVEAVEPATHAAEQAVIEAVPAETVDCAALTPAGLTVTAAVCVIPIALAVAEMVFACAVVEFSLVANTPAAFDVPLADGLKVLLRPVELTVTEAPLTRLPN
jgi:hypothetical protein